MTGRQQAGEPVERGGEIVASIIGRGLPDVERHAHVQRSWRVGPRPRQQGALGRDSGSNSTWGGGEGGLDGVTDGLEMNAAMLVDGGIEESQVVLDGSRHRDPVTLPVPGTAFNVGEEKGDGTAGYVHAPL